MTNTVEILNKADTEKKIASIRGRSATLRADIQAAVLGGLQHAADYGDATLLTKLVKATSPQNGAHLKRYIGAFAPLRWDSKAGQFKKAKKGGAFRVADAIDTDWDAELVKAKKEAAAYNGAKVRKSLVKRLADIEAAALEAGDFGLLEIVQDAAHRIESEASAATEAA